MCQFTRCCECRLGFNPNPNPKITAQEHARADERTRIPGPGPCRCLAARPAPARVAEKNSRSPPSWAPRRPSSCVCVGEWVWVRHDSSIRSRQFQTPPDVDTQPSPSLPPNACTHAPRVGPPQQLVVVLLHLLVPLLAPHIRSRASRGGHGCKKGACRLRRLTDDGGRSSACRLVK